MLSLARPTSFGGISPGMTTRTLLIAHVVSAVLGTAALWWFVMPGAALEAIADGISAAAVAGYAEIMAIRFGL